MSVTVLCLNVCRLCVPNIMSLGMFLKIAPRQSWHVWYSVKIRVIFGPVWKTKS